MSKNVYDSRQVAHVWAQQTQSEGRNHNGQFYFEGRTIYSYGRHYPAGYIVNDSTVLLNADKRSVTTSKHVSYAWSGAHGKYPHIFYVPDLHNWIISIENNGSASVSQYALSNENAFKAVFGEKEFNRQAKAAKAREKRKYESDRRQWRGNVQRWIKETGTNPTSLNLPFFGQFLYINSSWQADYTKHYLTQWALKVITKHRKLATEYNYPSIDARLKKLQSWIRKRNKENKLAVEKRLERGRIISLFRDVRAVLKGDSPNPRVVLAQVINRYHHKPYAQGVIDALRAAVRRDDKRRTLDDLKRWKTGVKACLPFIRDYEGELKALKARNSYAGVPFWPAHPDRLNSRPNALRQIEKLKQAFGDAHAAYEERQKAEKLDNWRKGEFFASAPVHPRGSEFAYLRIRGANVETSRGASVPLEHAVKLYRFMKALKQPWEAQGQTIRVGHFTLEYVRDDVAKIGCHKLHMDDMDALYNVYQTITEGAHV